MWRHAFSHLGLKVLSVGLAVLLWFMVAGQKQAERSLRVPLEFQNTPEHLELTSEVPDFVDVRVRGAAGTLGQLRSGDLVALVDLQSARPGWRVFHLSPEHVYVPTGVRVLQVQPTTISLQFESSVSKTVPIVPATDGEPAPGYTMGRVSCDPDKVEVIGPESAMRDLTTATTEPVPVGGATARVVDTVAIGLPHPAARLRVARTATVTIEIRPASVSREVADVPITIRNAGRGVRARLRPPSVTVTVKGAETVVRPLSAGSIPAHVDLAGLRRGNYNLGVRVDPRGRYEVVAVQPKSVSVRID